MTYFDYNATAPLSPVARDAWLRASHDFPGNPSSPHRLGTRAEAALNNARQTFARILECDPLDLVWTSGATESNNTVLHHVAGHLQQAGEVWVSAIEHPCVLAPAQCYFGSRLRHIPVLATGVVDLDWLARELPRNRPALVAVMAANNEIGTLQPWEQILDLCRRSQVQFLCDAAQWIGKLPGAGLGQSDWLTGCAHKFGGPKGVGFLKCPSRSLITPLIMGGEQEDGRRSGTENIPGVLAMVAALEDCESKLAASSREELARPRDQFENGLRKLLPGCQIVASSVSRLWNTTSALMPQSECQQRWVVKLDKAGFAVSTGSACSSGKEKPSHVLSAMGFAPGETTRMLRFSSGSLTTPADWQTLLNAILQINQELAPASSPP